MAEECELVAEGAAAQSALPIAKADDSPVRFRGKVAAWFYLLALGCNVGPLLSLLPFADPEKQGAGIAFVIALLVVAACDALFIPMIARNYVEFDADDNLVIAFGFSTKRIPIKKI